MPTLEQISKHLKLFVGLLLTFSLLIFSLLKLLTHEDFKGSSFKLSSSGFEFQSSKLDTNQIIEDTTQKLEKKFKAQIGLKEEELIILTKKLAILNGSIEKEKSDKKQIKNKFKELLDLYAKQTELLKTHQLEILNLNKRIARLTYKPTSPDKIEDFSMFTNSNLHKNYIPNSTYTHYLVKELRWEADACEIDMNVTAIWGEYRTKKECTYKVHVNDFANSKKERKGRDVELNFYKVKSPDGWCKEQYSHKKEEDSVNLLNFVMNNATNAVKFEEMLLALDSAIPSVCK